MNLVFVLVVVVVVVVGHHESGNFDDDLVEVRKSLSPINFGRLLINGLAYSALNSSD